MIIVLQSIGTVLEDIRRQTDPDRAQSMLFTSDHRVALARVAEEVENAERTIVITSNVFYGDDPDDLATQSLTGDIIALGVKGYNPKAWVFLYSVFLGEKGQHIDAIIPKEGPNIYAHVLQFLALDFTAIDNLGMLSQRLPWLR